MIVDIEKLKDIIEIEFSEIVEDVVPTDINELRIALIDGSFIDVWLEGRYRAITGRESSSMAPYTATTMPLT